MYDAHGLKGMGLGPKGLGLAHGLKPGLESLDCVLVFLYMKHFTSYKPRRRLTMSVVHMGRKPPRTT